MCKCKSVNSYFTAKDFEMRYRVFIKLVFLKILIYIPNSGLSRFSLDVSCVHNDRSNISTAAELAEFRKIITF